ncbi:FAD-binding protein [Niveispirillum sp. SYP-B3756]|uniref:NAD(P)/FAD-dependent oxidoreductase n=1 Tax=Niveispirillum sp. SYP-B3756 TaxID=2662178 RepID=UPI0012911AA8|nr:NAD(P)/FAD-dependent oxidoreductase [Niveispirillum sp. SYP-B3756]MQP65711.1 FAD-binding protein [Niveispirillum sp. SYP-B3756]
MLYDAIIIGGSFAGLSAAIQLVRARRRVLLLDAGRPRNRFAAASHGFLGQDGVPPGDITAGARAQLAAYPTLTMVDGLVEMAAGRLDDFKVTLADGRAFQGRRLVLAFGVRDELPDLPGVAERWGTGTLHCPYCHGYEVAGQPLGVLAGPAGVDHRALMLPDWGPTTLFLQGAPEPEPAMGERLAARGVGVERSPIIELLGPSPALQAVRLADGRVQALTALFVTTRTSPVSPLAAQLGCELVEGMTGPHVRTDGKQQTSVAGVCAAGDVASPLHNGTLASAAGVMAALATHHSLLGL